VVVAVRGSDLDPEPGPARTVTADARRPASPAAPPGALGFTALGPLHDGRARLVDWWRAAPHLDPMAGVPG
jgi:hypothetical protein